MTPQQIEAMKLALEALEGLKSLYGGKGHKLHEINMIHRNHDTAITVLEKVLAEHAMREVQRLGQEIEQEPVAVYGYCPQCGAKGVMRERRPNGNDKCANGHTYPSSTSTPPQRTWVDLPDEEIKILWIQYRAALPRYLCFAKALLSRAKEQNT